MPRLLAVLVAGLAVSGVFASAQTSSRSVPRPRPDPIVERDIQSALDAYGSGDDLAAGRWARSLKGTASVAYVEPVVERAGGWSRQRAAFMLEVALVIPFDSRSMALVNAGRSMVMRRPAPLGADAGEDRFEILWHQSALGLAQASTVFWFQQEYLDAIGPRFDEAAARGVTLETRLPLARAMAAATLCCWKRLPGEPAREMPSLSRGTTLEKALLLFEAAAGVPSLRHEALIRGAKLLLDSGRYEDARVWFDKVTGPPDPALEYVHHLTRGRVFDALDRPADAADAYGEALTFVPTGQLAAIGRAAALLRSGRDADAQAVAADARRMPAGRRDFDRLRAFNLADARFVPGWLAELRRLRR